MRPSAQSCRVSRPSELSRTRPDSHTQHGRKYLLQSYHRAIQQLQGQTRVAIALHIPVSIFCTLSLCDSRVQTAAALRFQRVSKHH